MARAGGCGARPPGAAPSVDDLLPRCTFPPRGTPLACAVSGGADSLALLVLAAAAGCAVTAHHVDHGLRPGSAPRPAWSPAAAARSGPASRPARVSVAPGPNLEARARAARFAVLPAGVATGHTMDDQAETILLNLLRGAGADGLAGMAPGPRHPLLGLRRAETHAAVPRRGLTPVRDASNDDPAFVRNRVRHELLPLCARGGRARPGPAAGPPGRRAARRGGAARRAGRASRCPTRPTPGPWPRADPAAGPARRCGAGCASAGDGGHPPSLAEVDRVLGRGPGRRGRHRAVRGAAGCAARGGRLRVEPADRSGSVTPVTRDEAGRASRPGPSPTSGPCWSTPARLAARVAELGAQITADYADEPPLLVAVLKGAMLFMSDLCRAIALPVDVDFMAVSSYGSATKTSGVVRIVKDLDSELEGRHVLVVEDIIDSGLTLNYLRRYLHARAAQERRGLRPAGQGGRAAGRARPELRRLHHPARVRRGLRPRRGRALPQPRAACTATRGAESVSVDVERRAGRRDRAAQRHRRGPRARRAGGHARRGSPPCTRSCSPACTTTRPAT